MRNSAAPERSIADCRSLGHVARLLGRLWVQETDLQLLQQFGEQRLRTLYLQAGGSLPTSHDQAQIDLLAQDYCQLFLGPKEHLPPYQSVWDSGQFQGEAVTSVRRYTDLLQYESDTSVTPDHLGVQLDLLAAILTRQADLATVPDQFNALDQVTHQFLNDHLKWATPLLAMAEKKAQTSFYRDMIRITGDFLQAVVTGS